ncbi:MAG: hypothetical protein ACRDQ5_11240 [Sciscionella sp.]
MSDDKIASMKIATLVRKLVRDKQTNPAAPVVPVVDAPVTTEPKPAQG